MKTTLLSYFDKKLGIYTAPIAIDQQEDNVLIEKMRRMCANPNLPRIYFEYDVYRVGTFDDKVGMVESIQPVYLCSLSDFKHLAAVEESEKEDVKVNS